MTSIITDRIFGESASVAVKAPCVAVALTPLLLNGLTPVGSYAPKVNDRILVTAEADPTTNGIYNASNGAWARSGDFDGIYDAVQGTLIAVYSPASGGSIFYQLTTFNPIIGTTPLNFSSFINPTSITYNQTQAEFLAGVVPVNLQYPPGNVLRYGAKGDAVNDDAPAIMAAMSCNADIYFPTPIASYGIKQPIYYKSTYPVNVTFRGQSRTTTIIQPLVINLSVNDPNLNGINAMIINQLANGKLSFSNVRLSSQLVAYTGITIYAVQPVAWSSIVNYIAGDVVNSGGNPYACITPNLNSVPPNANWALQPAGVGLVQSIFSGSMDNCWCDTGSTNAGFFKGALNNYRVSDTTFEFQKGCFFLQGAGGAGDVIFTDCVLSNCYDYFIQKVDAVQGNIVSVKGLHAYTHNRGTLLNLANCVSFVAEDVILQASTGGVNLGGIGIGNFTNCTDMQLADLNVMTNAAIGTGATATQLTFNGCTGQVSDSIFDGCDTGILITGGTNRLSFDHVDIVNTLTAAFRTTMASASGLVTADHCNWSDGQLDLVLFSQPCAFDFLLSDCRLMNAGLGGLVGARNFIPSTSGLVLLKDVIIGQNNVAAAANFYIDGGGIGPLVLIDPIFQGIAPTGLYTVTTQIPTIGRFVVPYSANMNFSAQMFDKFDITANNGVAFTVNTPSSPIDGKRILITIRNTSGGALGAVTWGVGYKLSAWAQPANGFSRSIEFRYDSNNWVQISQTGVDVPN